ncbi:hypothetical protein ABT354_03265 [Streptomyces sp. NPDC000594]|uniref:hypothetical protein n=1 Tax=Streptomyces sp. NPDC000594 TaxID=3154261 RepID=UPI0033260402
MSAPLSPRHRSRARRPARGAARPAGTPPVGRAARSGRTAHADPVGEIVRWAALCVLLVPVVLVVSGLPVRSAVVTGIALALLTVVCRAVLRYAQRGEAAARAGRRTAARAAIPGQRRPGATGGGHHRRTGPAPGTRRTGRHSGGRTPRD